jgi:cytochrome c-type protein NapB
MKRGYNMIRTIIRLMVVAGMSLALLFGAGMLLASEKQGKEIKKAKQEEELGIRHVPIDDEERVKPAHGEYSTSEPGKSKKFERAFENSPPLIPHDLTGVLPIAETNNMCVSCHMPEHAKSLGATPIPKSHFVKLSTGKDLGDKLDGERYFCMECHVPQVNIPEPIKNTFKADFRKKKDKTESSLLDSLNEGVKAD